MCWARGMKNAAYQTLTSWKSLHVARSSGNGLTDAMNWDVLHKSNNINNVNFRDLFQPASAKIPVLQQDAHNSASRQNELARTCSWMKSGFFQHLPTIHHISSLYRCSKLHRVDRPPSASIVPQRRKIGKTWKDKFLERFLCEAAAKLLQVTDSSSTYSHRPGSRNNSVHLCAMMYNACVTHVCTVMRYRHETIWNPWRSPANVHSCPKKLSSSDLDLVWPSLHSWLW